MVVFLLSVKADLENVSVLKAPPLHHWCLDVKQSDGEETRDGIFVSEEESHELTGSRGTAHFVLKFPGSKKESYLNVVRDLKKVIREYTGEETARTRNFIEKPTTSSEALSERGMLGTISGAKRWAGG